MQTITGNLEIIKRLPSSVNGNPRYLVSIGGVECYTAPDAGIAYGITNRRVQPVTATVKPYYNRLTIQTISEGV
jgi:hypothetical protein